MAGRINLTTGKIIGVEKGSFGWYHEKGHQIYNDSDLGIKKSFNMQIAFYTAVIYCVWALFFNFFRWFALIAIGMAIYYYMYEEFWCDNYAKQQLELIKMKGGIKCLKENQKSQSQ